MLVFICSSSIQTILCQAIRHRSPREKSNASAAFSRVAQRAINVTQAWRFETHLRVVEANTSLSSLQQIEQGCLMARTDVEKSPGRRLLLGRDSSLSGKMWSVPTWLAAESQTQPGRLFNICTGHETTLLDLLDVTERDLRLDKPHVRFEAPRLGDIYRSLGNPGKSCRGVRLLARDFSGEWPGTNCVEWMKNKWKQAFVPAFPIYCSCLRILS